MTNEKQKRDLEDIYQNHHKVGSRYGYLVCHGKRKNYIQSWLGTGKKILDLGCRDGELTQSFVKDNIVTGVDIDRVALAMSEKRLGIQTCWIDLNQQWPFQKNIFDAIVCCEILEHLYFINTTLDNVVNSLKPGGMFIGSVPNSFRLRNRVKFLFGKEFDNDPTHIHRFSYKKLEELLKRYFSAVEIIPIDGKIIPFLKVGSFIPKYFNILCSKMLLWKAVK